MVKFNSLVVDYVAIFYHLSQGSVPKITNNFKVKKNHK